MERFRSAMGFIVVGLLPVTLCGIIYLTEVLGG